MLRGAAMTLGKPEDDATRSQNPSSAITAQKYRNQISHKNTVFAPMLV